MIDGDGGECIPVSIVSEVCSRCSKDSPKMNNININLQSPKKKKKQRKRRGEEEEVSTVSPGNFPLLKKYTAKLLVWMRCVRPLQFLLFMFSKRREQKKRKEEKRREEKEKLFLLAFIYLHYPC